MCIGRNTGSQRYLINLAPNTGTPVGGLIWWDEQWFDFSNHCWSKTLDEAIVEILFEPETN